mgnify:FL=1
MITANQVKHIVGKLFWGNLSSNDELIENIACIIYRDDIFKCGNSIIHSKHIDIEFVFGEYCEIPQTAPEFQFICRLCNLTLAYEGQEIIIYQK